MSQAGSGQRLPQPDVAVGADGLLAVCERQDLLAQAAVLREGLLVHLLGDVSDQDLGRKSRRQGPRECKPTGRKPHSAVQEAGGLPASC